MGFANVWLISVESDMLIEGQSVLPLATLPARLEVRRSAAARVREKRQNVQKHPSGFNLASSRTESLRNDSPSWARSRQPSGTFRDFRGLRISPDGTTEFVRIPPVSSVPNDEINSASILMACRSESSSTIWVTRTWWPESKISLMRSPFRVLSGLAVWECARSCALADIEGLRRLLARIFQCVHVV